MVCSTIAHSPLGEKAANSTRLGLSFGGGGTGVPSICRDGRCATEHAGGVMQNNIIAHCNDSGIDINQATAATVAFNTLINTRGIGSRRAPASAIAYANVVEGEIRARDGTTLQKFFNVTYGGKAPFEDAHLLALEWRSQPAPVPTRPEVVDDFCCRERGPRSMPGALNGSSACPVSVKAHRAPVK